MTQLPERQWPGPDLALLAGAGLTILTVALLVAGVLPLGAPGEWEWLPRPELLRLGSCTLLAALLAVLTIERTRWLLTRPGRPSRAACAAVVLLCVVTSGALLTAPVGDDPVPAANLAATTTSIGAMGYYGLAANVDSLRDAFRIYVTRDVTLGLPGRIQTHPPGPFLWAHWGRRLTQAWPASAEWLMGCFRWRHGLTPGLLFGFARGYAMPGLEVAEVPGACLNGLAVTAAGALLPVVAFLLSAALWDRRAGVVAALTAATLPSLLAFVPSIDGLAAVLGVLPVALLAWALRRDNWPLAACSGLALAAALFWTTGLLAVGGPMLGLALASRRRRPEGPNGGCSGPHPARLEAPNGGCSGPHPARLEAPNGGSAGPHPARLEAPNGGCSGPHPARLEAPDQTAGPDGAPEAAAQPLPPFGPSARRPLVHLAVAGAVTLAAYAVLYLATGYNLLKDFGVMSQVHHGQVGGRSYLLWLPMNLWDFCLFMGPPLTAMTVASLLAGKAMTSPARGVALGMLGALLTILISGVTRGEVGRIWLFMMPLLSVGVSGWIAALPERALGRSLALLVGGQLVTWAALYVVLELVHP